MTDFKARYRRIADRHNVLANMIQEAMAMEKYGRSFRHHAHAYFDHPDALRHRRIAIAAASMATRQP